MRNFLSDEGEKLIQEKIDLDREAYQLLKLIDAEFQSDPTSVQCFDLRLVERVKKLVQKKRKIDPFFK